ncbi:MAG TPA: glycoside hydrolase family 5 protein [Clostridia bacterium]
MCGTTGFIVHAVRKISVMLLIALIGTSLHGCQAKTGKQREKKRMRRELTSLELVKLMGNGINLGNTMEAYGRQHLGTDAAVSKYETFWGQPVTTREMISGMKAAGFNTLRIPVAWTNTMKFESGDYNIRKDYLDRVEEIINYALDEDMYVIVNDHWDGGWYGMFGSASQETRGRAMDIYVSMWKQIAERYKNYGDHLIFEAANEELGDRFNDIDLCPDGNTLSKDECYELLTKVTQAFIDTVRSTGGNNKHRFLLIPGYNTDITATNDPRFKMPVDSAKNKLLLSVHYYTPWGYCGNPSLNKWGSEKDYREQNDLLAMMEKFTGMGYGVVIGEYSVAFNKDGSLKNNICDFLENFLNNCDLYGYCPVLWDCNGLYNKQECAIPYEEVAQLYKSRSYDAQQDSTDEEIRSQARQAIAEAYEKASAAKTDEAPADSSIAWIMFNSGDWALMYSVGDKYNPDAKTEGIKTTDAVITGPGTYTVSLDFTGTMDGYAKGTAFSALGVSNGETLYPGYFIEIKEILVNGEPYELEGKPYTTSDDGVCTRVNLYNVWVSKIPKEARTRDGDLTEATAILLDNEQLGRIETLSITFEYGP